MARIALVWEMGGGFGHVATLDLLAKQLDARGHELTIVTQQPNKFLQCAGEGQSCPYQLEWVESFAPPTITSQRPSSYSEILLYSGYYSVEWLTATINEWRTALSSLKPDLAIFDYAPTAQLASRGLGFSQINLGAGFCVPPRDYPMPRFITDRNAESTNLYFSDDLLVSNVNRALSALSVEPVTQASDIVDADGHFLTTIPELDPYATLRTDERYFGHLGLPAVGTVPLNWSDRPAQQRMFGYLKREYPHLQTFVNEVADQGLEARIFIPGLSDHVRDSCQTEHVQLSSQPFIMNSAYSSADFAVCHGGHSTMLQSILAGIPVLGIPLQTEQFMTVQRCIDVGMARGLNPHDKLGIHQELRNIQTLAATRTAEIRLGAASTSQSEANNLNELALASEALIRA